MHKFLRAIGLASIDSGRSIDEIIEYATHDAVRGESVVYNTRSSEVFEDGMYYRAQIYHPMCKGAGIAIRGFYSPYTDRFITSYYFPYVDGVGNGEAATVYAEPDVGHDGYFGQATGHDALEDAIFYIKNSIDYEIHSSGETSAQDCRIKLSALSVGGKIILGTFADKKSSHTSHTPENLVNLHNIDKIPSFMELNPDELLDTDDDIVPYSGEKSEPDFAKDIGMIARLFDRISKEDVFSIVDSSFYPDGLESNVYYVVGNILSLDSRVNTLTGEEIYVMNLECNDICFNLMINKEDLYGEPEVGRRFLGSIWLLGELIY